MGTAAQRPCEALFSNIVITKYTNWHILSYSTLFTYFTCLNDNESYPLPKSSADRASEMEDLQAHRRPNRVSRSKLMSLIGTFRRRHTWPRTAAQQPSQAAQARVMNDGSKTRKGVSPSWPTGVLPPNSTHGRWRTSRVHIQSASDRRQTFQQELAWYWLALDYVIAQKQVNIKYGSIFSDIKLLVWWFIPSGNIRPMEMDQID